MKIKKIFLSLSIVIAILNYKILKITEFKKMNFVIRKTLKAFIILSVIVMNIKISSLQNSFIGKEIELESVEVQILQSPIPIKESSSIKDKSQEIEYIEEETETDTDTEENTKEEANIDQEDLYWLAHVIGAENGNMSYRCQLYTGLVVVNRKEDLDFPNTIKDVVFADGQYAVVANGTIYSEPSEETWQIAKDILLEKTERIPEDVVYQAMFVQGSGVFANVDGNYFCYK